MKIVAKDNEDISIKFTIDEKLKVEMSRMKECKLLSGEAGEMSVSIMESLVDEVSIVCENDACTILLVKTT